MKTMTIARGQEFVRTQRGAKPSPLNMRQVADIIGGFAHRISGHIETTNGKTVILRHDGLLTTTEARCVLRNLASEDSQLWRECADAALELGESILRHFRLTMPLKQAASIRVCCNRR